MKALNIEEINAENLNNTLQHVLADHCTKTWSKIFLCPLGAIPTITTTDTSLNRWNKLFAERCFARTEQGEFRIHIRTNVRVYMLLLQSKEIQTTCSCYRQVAPKGARKPNRLEDIEAAAQEGF